MLQARTLEDAVTIMARFPARPRHFARDLRAISAFLRSLTGEWEGKRLELTRPIRSSGGEHLEQAHGHIRLTLLAAIPVDCGTDHPGPSSLLGPNYRPMRTATTRRQLRDLREVNALIDSEYWPTAWNWCAITMP